MNPNLLFDFSVNKETNAVVVKREFAAGLDLVWEAWTNPEILDQWWAPKPYHLETRTMDFREGGYWLYAMISPENQVNMARVDFQKIEPKRNFSGLASFCDDSGKINTDFSSSVWSNSFKEKDGNTIVDVNIKFENLEDLEGFVNMRFQEGFTVALGNLDQYLEAQGNLRKELNANNMTRVATYLNFPGNTEEAMNFYRSVFKTDFAGQGLQRFGDIPPQPGQPPLAEPLKKMILHVELPITAGHILMATDAPKEMGFTVTPGNNMHISLDLDNREETKRIFDELSTGGNITMPLKDMFWGAYYGAITDKYGINWMVNCANK